MSRARVRVSLNDIVFTTLVQSKIITNQGKSKEITKTFVTSAQPIITIVPDGTPLIVEAMALNQDIGFIQVGQKAELKLDTFPFQKYGTIEAELSYVSPDAQEDQKIGLVYKIKLKPKRFSIRVKDKDIPLSPGMALTAEIKTGERRVIEFFISPFIKYVDESLTLR